MNIRSITSLILGLFLFTNVSAQTCIPDSIVFTTQSQIDNFETTYPNCTEIEGDVIIYGPEIVNLEGLNCLSYIQGELSILSTYNLGSLNGLENIDSIGGNVELIGNFLLTDLSGMNSIGSIGGNLIILFNSHLVNLIGLDNLNSIGGTLEIRTAFWLENLIGIESLTSIGGDLIITENIYLNSLYGIENINAESIDNLLIYDNSVTTCEVQSICDYLASPNGTVEIYDNAPGCNSQEEVEEACTVGIPEVQSEGMITIYPNPTSTEITISGVEEIIDKINIYNKLGQRVIHEMKAENTIDVSWLPPGLYVVEVRLDGYRVREKLIVQ